ISAIDFVDAAKIGFPVCRKPRRLRERREDLTTHRFPKHFDAAHDRSGSLRLAEDLSRFKWTALPHIVSGALHRAEDLVSEFRSPGLAEGFGQITGFRGMTTVQEEPKQVGGVSEARHHHLRLEGIQLKK